MYCLWSALPNFIVPSDNLLHSYWKWPQQWREQWRGSSHSHVNVYQRVHHQIYPQSSSHSISIFLQFSHSFPIVFMVQPLTNRPSTRATRPSNQIQPHPALERPFGSPCSVKSSTWTTSPTCRMLSWPRHSRKRWGWPEDGGIWLPYGYIMDI